MKAHSKYYMAKCNLGKVSVKPLWPAVFKGDHALWGRIQGFAGLMPIACQLSENMQFVSSTIHACSMLLLPRLPPFCW